MANMTLSREGAMELIGHEGIVPEPYQDSVDVWTIGVGHTKAAGPPDPKSVATPLTWEEVAATTGPDDLRFSPEDVLARVAEHGDLAADLLHPDRPELPLASDDAE
jgi:GH24 family phage-related lysozyme (muramidase)